MKKIYFYPGGVNNVKEEDRSDWANGVYTDTYVGTEICLRKEKNIIHTTSMAHFSFNLIDMGYEIYLCYKDKKLKVEPGMKLACEKEVKYGHLISRMFTGHVFDEDLGIDYEKLV